MFKDVLELDKVVAERIVEKIMEENLAIEMEIGLVKQGISKVLFIHDDYELLNRVVSESTNEEYDLCPL